MIDDRLEMDGKSQSEDRLMKVMRLILVLAIFVPATGMGRLRAADLTLDDLGFSADQLKSDPATQATLHKRSKMLKTHQILGLITAVPMTATLFTGPGDDSTNGSKADRHKNLGIATGALYFTTASFSILAPEVEEKKATGATKIHKTLAWVHFPAMLIAPFLGYQAYKQRDRGEEVHGAAKHHSTVAGVAYGAYMASLLVMVWDF
ncbi:MAG: hypothetical protein JNK54_05805 [Elusimicrobia bacterium]|nr:hypothetical protein [Elusimicrobiota bacterium]